jgi:hypothetical protein
MQIADPENGSDDGPVLGQLMALRHDDNLAILYREYDDPRQSRSRHHRFMHQGAKAQE